MQNTLFRYSAITTAALLTLQAQAHAHDASGTAVSRFGDTGVSGLWILANISYAGMRAQNSSSRGWRIVAFIFGFPGTFLSFLLIMKGSGRAYGIQIPK